MDTQDNKFKNIQCIVLSILIITITVICAIFKGFSIQELIGVFVCGLVGTLVIRFSYELCLIHNRIHNAFRIYTNITSNCMLIY